ncbi:methyltransferase GidB [Oscillochloris trichoides DG-6]|uniref:Probable nicotinate-nucleotide adenylyltransferase n=1 Tax=Oscillochloris trichoides DG-6 TaxID=765420 RepID=E1IGN4_9CHLR|nr:nicotinate-nucleotide adenylyltransferase [Oscillochloris trichoides]EFO79621.1 methyltransferase GidB [Oscillochloris trichoides DG-6]
MTGQRIGVYGGTFDPVHIGHLAIAEEVRYALRLDQVLFVPAAHQPLKGHAPGATPLQRLEMVRLACASNPAFAVSDLELRRPPPSYTRDTLVSLRQHLPPTSDLTLIIGADAARDLPRWYRVHEILRMVYLVIVARPDHPFDLAELETRLPGVSLRTTLVDGPRLAVSSTDLRLRLATHRPTRCQIPDAVLGYIRHHGLYLRDALA